MKHRIHPRIDKLRSEIFHQCAFYRTVGLKPGILKTKLGDYGVRARYENENELKLNEAGFCEDCVRNHKIGA
jgi:hypothetical protein